MEKQDYIRMLMVEAMKSKDKQRKDTLSSLLSALKNAEIEKRRRLTAEEENVVVLKEIKQTKETLESCPSDRLNIIEECLNRIDVLQEFIPKQLTSDEIREIVKATIIELGYDGKETVAGKKDKGNIMRVLMPRLKGKADGKLVNQVVDEELY